MFIIENPTIPSAHPLREPLKSGSEIEVRGKVTHGHHKEFAIELLNGPNIILHINFRFEGEHEVVMNSFLNNQWGPEIRHRNPLRRHEPFHLRIHVHEGFYNISVNNEHLAEYAHRMPIQEVEAVGVKGSVEVESISVKRRQTEQGKYSGYGNTGYFAPQYENTQYY